LKEEYTKLISYIEKNDKDNAVLYTLSLLKKGSIGVNELYTNVLVNLLNNTTCGITEKECIWKAHVKRTIIETIIENCYPYIIEQKKESNKLCILITCPEGVTEDTGARMINDYFILAGYETLYLGSIIDKKELIDTISTTKPDYVCINANSCYDGSRAQHLMNYLKSYGFTQKMIVSGLGFDCNKYRNQMGFDFYINGYNDIESMAK